MFNDAHFCRLDGPSSNQVGADGGGWKSLSEKTLILCDNLLLTVTGHGISIFHTVCFVQEGIFVTVDRSEGVLTSATLGNPGHCERPQVAHGNPWHQCGRGKNNYSISSGSHTNETKPKRSKIWDASKCVKTGLL